MARGLDYVINLLDGNSSGVEKAKGKIGEVDKAVEGAHNRTSAWAKAIGGIGLVLGGVFATEKIIDFGKESLNAAKEIRMASAQVAQGITTTGGVAGKTLAELKERAEELENTTLFGDEQTMGADALLLTFTKIKGKIFDEAIPAIQDLATRMGGEGPADLKGAAIQVGKALNDPLRGITALQRVGVSFSKVQKDQIENLVEHNHLATAQKMILAELNTEFGGSAVAARKALGPQADLKVAYENLLKAVGPLIQNGLTPLLGLLTKGVTYITQWVGKYDQFVEAAKNGWIWIKKNADIALDLAEGIGITGAAFAIANPSVILYTAGLLINGGASIALAAAQGILTAAQWALNFAMSANPIGLIIVGIGALIGGLIYAYHHSEKFRAILSGIGSVAGVLMDIFVGLGKAIIGAFTFNPNMIRDGLMQSAKAVIEIKDKGFSGIFNKGYDSSITESEATERREKIRQAAADKAAKTGSATSMIGKPTGKVTEKPSTGGGGSGGQSTEGTAGGRSIKYLTITIQSLIKDFTQNVTNLKGHDGIELKRIVTNLIAEGVADFEILGDD